MIAPTHVIRVDPSGRTTLPKEAREVLKTKNAALTIEDGKIVIRPIPDLDRCIICGGEPEHEYHGRWICSRCLAGLKDE